jgi:hypothetical protein
MSEELYIVKRNIRYHNPDHELAEQLVLARSPEAKAGLPFPHLSEADKKLLVRTGVLVKKPAKKTSSSQKGSKK